jgi:hypothetical protein
MTDQANRRDWSEVQKAEAQVDILTRRVSDLEHKLAGLREGGDGLWYCLRHLKRVSADEIADAVEDYTEARDKAANPFNPNK